MQLPPLCLVLVVSDVVMMMLLHRISSCNWQKSILSKNVYTMYPYTYPYVYWYAAI